MAKAKIPDWFDLANYTMPATPEEWGISIDIRVSLLQCKKTLSGEKLNSFIESFAGKKMDSFVSVEPHTSAFPIMTMNAADLAVISASWTVDEAWQKVFNKVCAVVGQAGSVELYDELISLYRAEASLRSDAIGKVGWLAPEFCHGIPITVNLDADDETLKTSFEIWLAGAREAEGNRFKRSLTNDDFQKWHKLKILPAFDLYHWADINNVRLTNTQIANALFPPESTPAEERDIDMSERVRKVVVPLMEQTITASTGRLIRSSTRLEKLIDDLLSESGDEKAKAE